MRKAKEDQIPIIEEAEQMFSALYSLPKEDVAYVRGIVAGMLVMGKKSESKTV